ncbi:hypothetical protein B0T16DRAFT_235601 [Cercophora newfieldiana]|uniref:Ankyrin repeat protein n=1 Tax=Cercophora newfieldiana TaxID=92897 RepID=A0AA40CHU7_9PEZI|nr:hypothetical protein B0T16DRAFT_235601 [Cercophora newfieldiana]
MGRLSVKSPAMSPRSSVDRQSAKQPLTMGRVRQATIDHDGDPTCLSALPHIPNADRDSLFQHYLGCLEFHQRADFLDENNEFWTQQVRDELDKLKAGDPTADQESLRDRAKVSVRKNIQALAVSLEAQYKRTVVLRRALSRENPSDLTEWKPDAPGDDNAEPSSFVGYIDKSRRKWRDSDEYKAGMIEVQKWRSKHGLPVDQVIDPSGETQGKMKEAGRAKVQEIVGELRGHDSMTEKITGYDLERDVNAYLIQYTRQNSTDAKSKTTLSDPKMRHLPVNSYEEDLKDVRFKGKFPDQRLSIDLLLKSAQLDPGASEWQDILPKDSDDVEANRNILSKANCDKKDPTRMRYLHIPANNMEWVEAAIAGYYGDKHPALRPGHRDVPPTTKTQMLLRPQFWRGQLHGARSGVVHARYMRPLCERISSTVHEIEDNPNNIVLFMPYMHWETDRMRNSVAKMVDDQSYQQILKQEQNDLKAKNTRIAKRAEVTDRTKQIKHGDADPIDHLKILLKVESTKQKLDRSLTGLVPRFTKLSPGGIEVEGDGHLRVNSERPLGQYLIDAARLYEAMSTFRDKRMIEKYLYNNPPLHPRRTLDQSHYWTLKTTKARDRDQVVYRGTNINLDLCHKFRKVPVPKKTEEETEGKVEEKAEGETDEKPILERLKLIFSEHDPSEAISQDGTVQGVGEKTGEAQKSRFRWPLWGQTKCEHARWQWIGHWSKTDEHGCEHCTSEIKKISKLIMVDQLWMWVLDEQTIITSFPRRYGYNKYDLHGIHKSIRNSLRLANARKNQIRSIFDVALIILDECSNTFFDRTKTHDSQPQVMDIFSEAIGDVTNKHTISFQHVWHWTQKASTVYRSKPKHGETSDLHVPLLDIHPEGKLQREVKDILDELDIMINITRRQRELIRRFCKHVENILDPEGRWRHGTEDQSLAQVDNESEDEADPPPEEYSKAPDTSPQNGTVNDKIDEEQKKKEAKERAHKERLRDRKRRKNHLDWFRMQSQDLLSEVGDRIEELEGLRESAKSTAQSVNDLLSLKQQQASVVQAWESVNQAEEAVRQGRSIMMFTIITIVFLPLSFMSSIFGMNNVDFEDDKNTWTLSEQLRLMFPISIGIMAVSLIFAFHGLFRASIWSAYTYAVTWVAVHTGLYHLWLEYGSKNFHSASLMRGTEEKVHELKEEVRKARRRKKAEEYARKLSKTADAEGEPKADETVGVVFANGATNGAANGAPKTASIGSTQRSRWRKVWHRRRRGAAEKREDKTESGHQAATPILGSRARSLQSNQAQSPQTRSPQARSRAQSVTFADGVGQVRDIHAGTPNIV